MRERGLVSSPNEDISVIFTDCFWMLLALPSKMCPRLHARSTAEHHPWSPGKAVNSTAFLSRNVGISGTEVGYVYKNNQHYSSPDYLILVSSCQSLRLISQGQAKFSGNWTSLVISFFSFSFFFFAPKHSETILHFHVCFSHYADCCQRTWKRNRSCPSWRKQASPLVTLSAACAWTGQRPLPQPSGSAV